MSKFKVNDEVVIIATGKTGVVKAKETVKATDGSNHTKVEYLVKLGEGFHNWDTFERKELMRAPFAVNKNESYVKKVYDAPNGYKLTLVGFTTLQPKFNWNTGEDYKVKFLYVGHSICNPNDNFDDYLGFKLARRRALTKPFVHMSSRFTGEFNKETIEAIMDAKASYIINNFDKFIQI